MNWNGESQGTVESTIEENSISFLETGIFTPANSGKHLKQRNIYRWEFKDYGVNVYQERRDDPVFLVKLIWENGLWITEEAHLCVRDLYSLSLIDSKDFIQAEWKIRGPKKDETLKYIYTY